MSPRRAPFVVAATAVVLVLPVAAHAALTRPSSAADGAAAGTTSPAPDASVLTEPGPAQDGAGLLDADPTDPRIGRREAPVPAATGTSRATSRSATSSLSAGTVPTLTQTFKTSGYQSLPVPTSAQPYANQRAGRVDTHPHDAKGVRKILIGGRLYDHPVAQAQWGIANVNSYLATKDVFYLNRAIANAQQIIASRVSVQTGQGVAWFFKYPFDFALHSGTAFTERAPWYSGMAQGLAISLFTRLVRADPAEATHWRTAAYGGYRAFLVRSTSTAPWVVHVDSDGYLWLDEYPIGSRVGQSDLTLNGHLFAEFGLYDYYQLTKDAGALRLFDGATTTAWHYLGSFRSPNWLSRYCLLHGVRDIKYHGIHAGQLLLIYRMTHAAGFADQSVRFGLDYPSPTVDGSVYLAKGKVTAYRFSSSGAIVGSRSLTLSSASSAPASSRTRVHGRGIYLNISSGYFKGYAVAEAPGRAYLKGTITLAVWAPPVRRFAYTTASQLYGRPAGSGVVAGEVASTDALVLIGGRLWYRIKDGRNAGTYVLYGTVRMDA